MRKPIRHILFFLLLVCLACSGSSASTGWIEYGPASELQGDYWFHVTQPLTLSRLQGRVLLIDVWQFT
jgi:hypothetical protein